MESRLQERSVGKSEQLEIVSEDRVGDSLWKDRGDIRNVEREEEWTEASALWDTGKSRKRRGEIVPNSD